MNIFAVYEANLCTLAYFVVLLLNYILYWYLYLHHVIVNLFLTNV